MTCTLTAKSAAVIRDADDASIPGDPGNVDWRACQAWRAAGNAPNPAPSPPAPVPSCALWQSQAVMTLAQRTAVQGAVSIP
jgi:hypothetical protein